MRSFAAAIFSAFVALASARTTPDYSLSPAGNPIYTPGLNEQVPIGEPFAITWDPTTTGTVSLVLLRGPSTNVVPLKTLVEGIPNSGSYEWTPSADLEVDTTHYGLLLVVDATGEYQYSTQFGISDPNGVKGGSSTTATATTTAITTTAAPTTTTDSGVSYTTIVPTTVITKTRCSCPSSSAAVPCSSSVPPTSKPVIPVPVPTITTSVNPAPTSPPSATPEPPVFTGAAAQNVISFGAIAAGVAAALVF